MFVCQAGCARGRASLPDLTSFRCAAALRAVQGVEKTRELVSEKVVELEADVEQLTAVVGQVVPSQAEVQRDALVLEGAALAFLLYQAYSALANQKR